MTARARHRKQFKRARGFIACLGCSIGVWMSPARADPAPAPPSERELHVAQCIAALDAQTRALARQLKAGHDAVRPLLMHRLEAGAAFIGDAYLHGNRDEARARALAEQSLDDQKNLTDAQRAELQAACAEEGTALLVASNGFGRFVVKRFAKKRMAKLLEE